MPECVGFRKCRNRLRARNSCERSVRRARAGLSLVPAGVEAFHLRFRCRENGKGGAENRLAQANEVDLRK